MALKRALLLAVVALVATTGVVFAGFVPNLLSNGTANESEIRAFVQELKDLRRLDQSQLRIIEVVMDKGGTGWHTHPGTPSLVIVDEGQIDFISSDRTGECTTRRLNTNEMIFHPSSAHDMRPVGDTATFTVLYFSAPNLNPLTTGVGAAC